MPRLLTLPVRPKKIRTVKELSDLRATYRLTYLDRKKKSTFVGSESHEQKSKKMITMGWVGINLNIFPFFTTFIESR